MGGLGGGVTVADSPDSNLCDVREKPADPWFGFRGSAGGLLCLRVLLGGGGGAGGTGAGHRGSAEQKRGGL